VDIVVLFNNTIPAKAGIQSPNTPVFARAKPVAISINHIDSHAPISSVLGMTRVGVQPSLE